MKIISNEKLIKRNAKIGQATSLSSLVILGLGMYISFQKPELFNISIGALLVGFILSQVGIYFGNRWGRSPRPDELLDQGLKGIPGEYTLYHYSSPVPNLLVGPAGIWLLLPFHQHGTIIYDGKKWKTKGGGFTQSYMKVFGQESMSRPDLDAGAFADKLTKALKKEMPEEQIPPIQAALVFTSKTVEVEADDAPVPTLHLKKLKPFIRKMAKEAPITAKEIKAVNDALSA
ncbi:MAG: hypothetical protein HN390_07880 [Anaerolineae bacterium]|jgi:hypothetical protein|nr:hypothetical protein [Anaerolineae bacterium]MBT7191154.1 hypothetical protein [Anaerolineae bacterium]MBT7988295.1 hypothetical protein [Anaerolineae bacterium]